VFRKQIDTLRIKERDSVVFRQVNDTIYIEKYKTLYKDHTSLKHDTTTKYIDRVIKSPETKENKGKFKYYAIIVCGTIIAMLLMIVGGFMIFRR
jgi:predicted small integral membrane protein